jgi:hypothetical protein
MLTRASLQRWGGRRSRRAARAGGAAAAVLRGMLGAGPRLVIVSSRGLAAG